IYFIGQKGIPAKFGGIERHVEELSVRLSDMGHEVFVYTRPNYTPSDLKKYRGVNLICLSGFSTKNFDTITHTFRACIDVIRKRDADIIHFHSIGPASLIWIVKLFKPNTAVLATFHSRCYLHKKWGFFAKAYLKFGEFMACKAPERTITVSRSLAKYAGEKYRVNTEYIPNGVPLFKKREPDEIRKWGLETDNYILAVSRLIGHKGLHFLIEAYKNIVTDKKLVIVGDGVHSEKYVARLHNLSEGNSNIIFTGGQTGKILEELYSNAYLFVQPSESEGLSIALLEAMAYENPALASDIEENKEAAGDDGLYFRSKDVSDLQKKLEWALENSLSLKNGGILNRKRAEKFYNWDEIAKNTADVYKEVILSRQVGELGVKKIRN
ncbi:MAG: glycosyltransferase family 4 protein, partial [bacterium]